MDSFFLPFLMVARVVLQAYLWVVFATIITNWLIIFQVLNTHHIFVRRVVTFCCHLTEPILGRIRRLVPFVGDVDLSYFILLLAVYFCQVFLDRLILHAS